MHGHELQLRRQVWTMLATNRLNYKRVSLKSVAPAHAGAWRRWLIRRARGAGSDNLKLCASVPLC